MWDYREMGSTQEGHSHWILDLPMPLSWTLQTPKSWELSICCLRCAPVVCCYISPKWGEETVTENTSVRRRVAKRGLCGSAPTFCEMLNQVAVVKTHGRKGNPETLRTFRKDYLSSRWMDASFQEISFAAFGYRFFSLHESLAQQYFLTFVPFCQTSMVV